MGKVRTIARRTFLIGSAAIAGGVAFGTFLYRKSIPNPLLENLRNGEAAITPYVKIDADGVTLITPRCDVGQGAYSIQASLIAEELDVDPFKVTVSPGLPDAAYYNSIVLGEGLPFAAYDESWLAGKARDFAAVPAKILGVQLTGGSTTVPEAFEKLRMAGAVARETLKEAAAQKRAVPRASLTTKDGHVIFADGSRLAYTDLAVDAARLAPIENVSLRPTSEWKLLGKRRQRIDIVAKSTGTLDYGIDLALPGMVHASARTNPGIGGQLIEYDATAAKSLRGVIRVVPISHGIAVVADNTWRAMRAVNAIDIKWGPAPYPSSQEELWQTLVDTFEDRYDSRSKDEGDVEESFASDGANIIEAEYRVPYLAHAPLEPMNAIVKVSADTVEIWTGTQIPRFVQQHVADLVDLDVDAIKLYVQPMGGSFGRRLDDNYILQAVEIAQAMKGTPVKMTWTREEDMTHDYPRPAAIARVKGAVAQGQVVACDIHVASQSVTESWSGRLLGTVPGPDPSIVSGAWDQPLAIPNYRVTGYRAPQMVPISPWRSVGYSGVGFLHGGFLDELFAAANVDPMDELIRLCNFDLARNVLQRVKDISGWSGRQIGEGRARGVAFTMSFGVPTAEVVEVSQSDRGIVIDRVFVVVEVGTVLDPDNLEAQVEGGVVWGLGHAMNCELTYRDHAPVQTNYHAFQGMRLYQAPEIVVAALERGDTIRGIGEPPVPPAAAALANAIFALTGKRIRELPLHKHIKFA